MTKQPVPAESAGLVSIIHSITGFLTGKDHADTYQAHKLTLLPNTYALHLPSGKAGRITGTAMQETEEGSRNRYKKVYGIAWDAEYDSTVLRRITPKQYKALPEECKITSYETGIY